MERKRSAGVESIADGVLQGELLKYKAERGVRVMVHVWNEALSLKFGGM